MSDRRVNRSESGLPGPNICNEPCPIERGMRVLGGKWKGSILWHLRDGPMRFNALARELGGASKKMINERLKELEEARLVHREVVSTKPVAVTYELTDFGRSALGILESLAGWCEEHGL
ncbi:helix-turn-helix domain-containing protein [Methyloceanibacter sp.]|uniref:winged helix-turn-helix transcriptional regulator n=1 Tax=Methyloceanibacter sp. TaxID=1965321 RepID=UPI002087F861|nr:helix-turn-helix domain-containing protein [Methyloceanibacter sp.]GFO83133.1 MAG: HxlR family transcriptional regulator [Methyloceanibacter sp.]HML90960.1 helix-turn-helix domain-containing protein [Methyloceanibacter sp.]